MGNYKLIRKYIFSEVSCVQHEDYKYIYKLNGYDPKKNKIVYRYMPLKRFYEYKEKKEMVFVSPTVWEDPYESKFLAKNQEYERLKDKKIFCLCVTNKKIENEAAAWKMYSPNDNAKSIKVYFNLDEFLARLNEFAKREKKKVYIGNAIYSFTKKEIDKLDKEGELGNDIFFPKDFSIEHYLSLMCLKRSSFSFENEIRIFIVDKKKKDDFLVVDKFPFDEKIISAITISPIIPFSYDDSRKRIYNRLLNLEFQNIKKDLIDRGLKCKIYKSSLYVKK
ncbi:DUF2971 domain-containing protein [Treponema rectale]|uniref:DUF2971 domain-containing protein n=1 Tax=Treponema rectale TaxID=744512 RepID=A0A840SER2_9SPIR|nr:hypothetical protein [Treponema rectale]MBB5219230.1 hypothetical protein [Treponema rectale]QOS40879.1 DUF2971 domain-containing protein [Treponema rectale]